VVGGQEGDVQVREKEHCSDVWVVIEYDAPLDRPMALKCRKAQQIQGWWGKGGKLFPPHPLTLTLRELTRKLQHLGYSPSFRDHIFTQTCATRSHIVDLHLQTCPN
jgi:hypothetical protein